MINNDSNNDNDNDYDRNINNNDNRTLSYYGIFYYCDTLGKRSCVCVCVCVCVCLSITFVVKSMQKRGIDEKKE